MDSALVQSRERTPRQREQRRWIGFPRGLVYGIRYVESQEPISSAFRAPSPRSMLGITGWRPKSPKRDSQDPLRAWVSTLGRG